VYNIGRIDVADSYFRCHDHHIVLCNVVPRWTQSVSETTKKETRNVNGQSESLNSIAEKLGLIKIWTSQGKNCDKLTKDSIHENHLLVSLIN
jgi:hypothetical protein